MRALMVAGVCWMLGVAPARADGGPLVLEFPTPLGEVQLEVLSLDDVERRGRVIPMVEKAMPTFSPSTNFDRTDLVIHYVLAVPVLRF